MSRRPHPALRLLWRDARSGELNLLIASLILAVATVTCINLFTDRIQRSIAAEATTLLAADAQVRGNQPIPDEWREQAQTAGLTTADIVSFNAMAIADQDMQLAAVKAVEDTYPLRGELTVSDEPYGAETPVAQGPPSGEVWLSSRLFAALDVTVGDEIAIGSANFTVGAALLREPDNSGSFFGAGTRVMINLADVPATQAVQTGSRVNYRWLLASDDATIETFQQWLKPKLGQHFRWVAPDGNNRGVGDAIERSERFLLLAGSLGVVLAGAALALAARRYAARQKAAVALLKTLGMVPRQILRLYLGNILLLGLVTTAVGLLLGWLLHNIIVVLMGNLLPDSLAQPGSTAYLAGAGVGLLALFGFAAPPLLALRKVPPVSVLRSMPSELSGWWHGIPGMLAVIAMILAYSQNVMLTLYIAAGGLVAIVGVGILASGLVRIAARLAKRLTKGYRLGVANLYRHRRHNSVQIMLFSILLMLMLVLYTLRTSMLDEWRSQLPENAPNHFAYNIFTSEKPDIQALFDQHEVETSPFYPMARGRLTQVNGVNAAKHATEAGGEPRNRRELNLTWSDTLAEDNRILQGEWWGEENFGAAETLLVSIEESFAESYKIAVGDTVTVSLSGERREAQVASIRSVQWDSMQPNFYLIFNRPLVDLSMVNWLTSFYLPPEQKEFVNNLARNFPTVSLVELDQMISQVQSIISQVSRAIDFILALIVSAGLLVLVASVQATLDVRRHESAVLRALGASRRLVFTSLWVEFSAMGILAGLMAALGAEAMLYLMMSIFEMTYRLHWQLWLAGPLLGILLVGSVGLLSTASVVRVPPMGVLRRQ